MRASNASGHAGAPFFYQGWHPNRSQETSLSFRNARLHQIPFPGRGGIDPSRSSIPPMKTLLLAPALFTPLFAADFTLTSPDQHLKLVVGSNDTGSLHYTLSHDTTVVLRESKLGLVREDADFSKGLVQTANPETSKVTDKYEIATAKRRSNQYAANRAVLHFKNPEGRKLDLIFQLSNDGLGFRYSFPENDATVHKLTAETTSYHFPSETKAWLQPIAKAKSGWASTNPSYEEYHEQEIPVGTPSPTGAGWVYPALFRTGDTWILLSESAPQRGYCNTRLSNESPDGEYGVAFPDPRETVFGGPALPQSTSPWITPWRVVVVGSLKTVAESMLGVDLADKPKPGVKAPMPGIASWSWPLLGDPSCNYETQKRFIDYAADMGWHYTLIDAMWDKQIGDEKMKELVRYGRGKNVEILVWLNSAGDWNTTFQTPKSTLISQKNREDTFKKLKEMGISGVKVDFFPGDGQSVLNYQLDILEEAARQGLSVNFHGTTLPRGLQRTYPNFMTAEAIKGLEFMTFEQGPADREPTHAAMLPFTRNVFDPMDFTPMALDKFNNRIKRRTTAAFELALPVLFTSGIQHLAEIPEGMAKAPDYVTAFLKKLPASWDDSKFIDGYPGKYAVMARRTGKHWLVAGINALNEPKSFKLDLSALGATTGRLITDGNDGELKFSMKDVKLDADKNLEIQVAPRGGFVIILQ